MRAIGRLYLRKDLERGMNNYTRIVNKSVGELTEWLDKYGSLEETPWIKWFSNKYCEKCLVEEIRFSESDKRTPCSWCEIHHKCRFFQDKEEIPDNKEIILMWLMEDA